jgi:hypothetical protein
LVKDIARHRNDVAPSTPSARASEVTTSARKTSAANRARSRRGGPVAPAQSRRPSPANGVVPRTDEEEPLRIIGIVREGVTAPQAL